MGFSIRGIQQAQLVNQKIIAALEPDMLGRAVIDATMEAQRYMIAITHVDTGALRASERVVYDAARQRGTIYLDPAAVNPKSGQRTTVYGPYENRRGGEHAFRDRTLVEAMPGIIQKAGRQIVAGLE